MMGCCRPRLFRDARTVQLAKAEIPAEMKTSEKRGSYLLRVGCCLCTSSVVAIPRAFKFLRRSRVFFPPQHNYPGGRKSRAAPSPVLRERGYMCRVSAACRLNNTFDGSLNARHMLVLPLPAESSSSTRGYHLSCASSLFLRQGGLVFPMG